MMDGVWLARVADLTPTVRPSKTFCASLEPAETKILSLKITCIKCQAFSYCAR